MAVTLEKAAAEAGVSQALASVGRRVLKTAAPAVVEAVKAGKLTLHAAEQIVSSVPDAEQSSAVAVVVEASKGKARHSPAR